MKKKNTKIVGSSKLESGILQSLHKPYALDYADLRRKLSQINIQNYFSRLGRKDGLL